MTESNAADREADGRARARLRAWLRSQEYGEDAIEAQVTELYDPGGIRSRFAYFMPLFDDAARQRLLVSGTAIGTEMLLARDYGFESVCGTEVTPDLVEICRLRIADQPGLSVTHYDGKTLPFADASFTAVTSGHVIEHTWSPREYMREHLRVLAPRGFMFLEFPTRYHRTELHTGLVSLEWLPKALRRLAIKALVSRLSPMSGARKRLYQLMLDTLQPVSVWQIRWWAFLAQGKVSVEDCAVPAKGIIRLVLRKA